MSQVRNSYFGDTTYMYVSYRAYLYVSMLKNRFRISGLLLAYSSALWVRFGILISEIVVTCVYLGSYSFSYFGYTTEVYGNLFNLFNLLQTDLNSGGVLYMGVTWRAKFITRWLSLHGPFYGFQSIHIYRVSIIQETSHIKFER